MERIERLQGLRGVAIIFVLLWHLNSVFPQSLPSLGDKGVEIFLLISGYLVANKYYTSDKLETIIDSLKYAFNKFKKIYVLYVLGAIPWLVVMLIKGSGGRYYGNVFFKFILYLAGLQSFIPSAEFYWAFNFVMWFWSALLFCYICTPIFFKIAKRSNTLALFFLVIILEVIVEFVSVRCLKENMVIFITYIFPPFRSLDYFAGIILWKLIYQKENKKSKYVLFVSIVIYFIISIVADKQLPYSVFRLLDIALFVAVVTSDENDIAVRFFDNPIMLFWGNLSSYIFLLHLPIIYIGEIFWKYIIKSANVFWEWICLLFASIFLPFVLKKIVQKINNTNDN